MDGIAEADVMLDWLIRRGMEPERVHVEREADSTVSEGVADAACSRRSGVADIVAATSEDHVRRVISDYTIAGSTVLGAALATAAALPDIAPLAPQSRLGLTVDATKVIGIPRTY